MSKTALLGLTKVLAEECAPDGIRVNCIAPGFIKTAFSSAVSVQFVFCFLQNYVIIYYIVSLRCGSRSICSSHEHLPEVPWTVTSLLWTAANNSM